MLELIVQLLGLARPLAGGLDVGTTRVRGRLRLCPPRSSLRRSESLPLVLEREYALFALMEACSQLGELSLAVRESDVERLALGRLLGTSDSELGEALVSPVEFTEQLLPLFTEVCEQPLALVQTRLAGEKPSSFSFELLAHVREGALALLHPLVSLGEERKQGIDLCRVLAFGEPELA